MTTVDIYRDGSLFVTIKPDDNSVQAKKIMGDNQLTLVFRASNYIDFHINDYCTVFGEKYILNRLPVLTKKSTYLFEYSLTMQFQGADLAKVQYLFYSNDNDLKESDFALMGNANTFIDQLLLNMNRVSSGWTKGQVINTAYKSLSFSKESCYDALSRLATEFETEFWIEGKVIHLTKRQTDTGKTFKHGKNKGLYEISRTNLNDSDIATRLYAYGSTKNLPPNYFGPRLILPGGDSPTLISNLTVGIGFTGPNQDMVFNWTAPTGPSIVSVQIEWRVSGSLGAFSTDNGSYLSPRNLTLLVDVYEFRFRTFDVTGDIGVTSTIVISGPISSPVFVYAPIPYVEKNVAVYGVIEATQIFEDIFPHRNGKVTSVDATNFYKFIDADIDFNVNDQLLPGISAKVTFNTGQLAGYEFEISSFNNSTKEFILLKNRDERVLDIPSFSFKPAIGDKYVLTDIQMPQTYIDAAELELKNAALALLDQLSTPQLSYQVTVDPTFIQRVGWLLTIGDLVWIVDAQLQVQRKIRIVSTTRNILNENFYQLELSDAVSPSTIARILSAQLDADRDINSVDQAIINTSILNNNVIGDLKMKQGTLVIEDIPTTAVTTGFSQLYIKDSDGKVYKKV